MWSSFNIYNIFQFKMFAYIIFKHIKVYYEIFFKQKNMPLNIFSSYKL